jgi:hypothetical protein
MAAPGAQRERAVEAIALTRMAIDALARGGLGYVLITARAGPPLG